MLKRYNVLLLLVLLLVIGVFFRFSNLNWGAPYYFHPDERNIASSITQLSFPNQMNPHFFAYGSFPLYTVYMMSILTNIVQGFFHTTPLFSVSFDQAIILGRFLSAFLSVSIILLIYLIGRKIRNKTTGLIAAFFTTTSIGFIQYAHFSTFEIWLAFFTTLLFYIFLFFLDHPTKKLVIIISIIFGILVGIKVSSLALLLPISLLFFYTALRKYQQFIKVCLSLLLWGFLFLCFSCSVFFTTNPFVLLSQTEFISSIQYESNVATGILPVFYTEEFTNTIPIYYQFRYVFLFLLGPLLLFFFFPGCIYIFSLLKDKKSAPFYFLLLFFFSIFFSQAFFFVKWTRYMIPVLPFIYLILAVTLSDLSRYLSLKKHIWKSINILFLTIICTVCFSYASIFVYSTYYQPDTRIVAMQWAKKHLHADTNIISEVYDLGIVPFNAYFPHITLFNFYDLEHNMGEQQNLKMLQNTTPIFILPSQRIIKTRIKNKKKFPNGYSFYNELLSEKKYKKIYETPCDIFCRILYYGDPVFSFEDTITVFDKPSLSLYQKI